MGTTGAREGRGRLCTPPLVCVSLPCGGGMMLLRCGGRRRALHLYGIEVKRSDECPSGA